jgi:hypothetical protein
MNIEHSSDRPTLPYAGYVEGSHLVANLSLVTFNNAVDIEIASTSDAEIYNTTGCYYSID